MSADTNKYMIVVVDLETGGLSAKNNPILEIGAIAVNEKTLVEQRRINLRIRVDDVSAIDPEAAAVNGFDFEKVDEWNQTTLSLEDALNELISFSGYKPMMVAYNANFDFGFLEAAFNQTGIKNPFYKVADLLSFVRLYSVIDPSLSDLRSFSLKSVCEHLGINPEDDIHRAINGAEKVYELLRWFYIRHSNFNLLAR